MMKDIQEKLYNFQSLLRKEVEGYQSPSEMYAILQNGITKALTKGEVDNINDQFDIIKKNILFQKDKFVWNDASQKIKTFSNAIKELDKLAETMCQIVTNSFTGRF